MKELKNVEPNTHQMITIDIVSLYTNIPTNDALQAIRSINFTHPQCDHILHGLQIVMENNYFEFGDLLFSLVNYARFIDINPETALERTNKKFIKRFQYLEEKAKEANKNLKDMTLAEMDIFWEEAKKL